MSVPATKLLGEAPILCDVPDGMDKYQRIARDFETNVARGTADHNELPQPGTFIDQRMLTQMLDELRNKGIEPEKWYWAVDDWEITANWSTGVPEWNGVRGVALYRRGGAPQFAKAGLWRKFDPWSEQWSQEFTLRLDQDRPIDETAYAAAPSVLTQAVAEAAPDISAPAPSEPAPSGPAPSGQAPSAAEATHVRLGGPNQPDPAGFISVSVFLGYEDPAAGERFLIDKLGFAPTEDGLRAGSAVFNVGHGYSTGQFLVLVADLDTLQQRLQQAGAPVSAQGGDGQPKLRTAALAM